MFSRTLLRDCFQREIVRARAQQADVEHDDQHTAGDEREDSACAEAVENKSDHERAEDHRYAAPGIDETHRSGANARGIKLSLIGMTRKRKDIICKREQYAEEYQQ